MNEQQSRIFFALWPDALTRRKIYRSYHSIEALADLGQPVRVQNLHMTLHFIGNVSAGQVEAYIRAAERVRVSPFTLNLTAIGSFAKAGVSWLGCSVFPSRLSDLHKQLGDCLVECGYHAEERVFRPHVTLARKIRQPVSRHDVEAVRWPVKRFVLLQSLPIEGGVMYRVRHSWPLT